MLAVCRGRLWLTGTAFRGRTCSRLVAGERRVVVEPVAGDVSAAVDAFLDGLELDPAGRVRAASARAFALKVDSAAANTSGTAALALPRLVDGLDAIVAGLAGDRGPGRGRVRARDAVTARVRMTDDLERRKELARTVFDSLAGVPVDAVVMFAATLTLAGRVAADATLEELGTTFDWYAMDVAATGEVSGLVVLRMARHLRRLGRPVRGPAGGCRCSAVAGDHQGRRGTSPIRLNEKARFGSGLRRD